MAEHPPLPVPVGAPSPSNVLGVVLAGGQGRRMGGIDKGLVSLHGIPLVQWALRRLQPQVATVAISANRHIDRYQTLVRLVISDDRPDYCGPLAGIEAILKHATHDWIATVPCDTPLAPIDWVGPLLDLAQRSRTQAAFLQVDEGGQQRDQPGFSLIHRSHAGHLSAYLDGGHRAWRGWLAALGAEPLLRTDPMAFTNVNTPEDVMALERRLLHCPELS